MTCQPVLFATGRVFYTVLPSSDFVCNVYSFYLLGRDTKLLKDEEFLIPIIKIIQLIISFLEHLILLMGSMKLYKNANKRLKT